MLLDGLLPEGNIEYQDERIMSDLYMISLSTSLRKLESMKPPEYEQKLSDANGSEAESEQRDVRIPESVKRQERNYKKAVEENEWLYEACPETAGIPVISMDKLKDRIDRDKKSCDGLFYYAKEEEEKLSLLMELKNIGRKKLLEYIGDEGNDGIAGKVRDSVELLRNHVEFQGGYAGEALIRHMHLVLVYGGKADTVSRSALGYGGRNRVERDSGGRQSRAATIPRVSVKQEEQVLRRFGEYVERNGLASCPNKYFGFPSKDPDEYKTPQGKQRKFTIFSKEDLSRVIKECHFFEGWEWGNYKEAFPKEHQSEA